MVSKKIAQALAGSSVTVQCLMKEKKWQHVMVLRTYMISCLGNPATPAPESVNRSDQRDRGRDESVRVTWLYVKFRI